MAIKAKNNQAHNEYEEGSYKTKGKPWEYEFVKEAAARVGFSPQELPPRLQNCERAPFQLW
jgi:hypothetical protein